MNIKKDRQRISTDNMASNKSVDWYMPKMNKKIESFQDF